MKAKKRAVVLVVVGVLALTLLAPGAFAAVTANQDSADWFNQMFNSHQQWVNQAVENGQFTPEQGQAWSQHFDQMKQYQTQNGYGCPGFGSGMMGGYGGMMGNFNGGSGYGGMMGGFGSPAPSGSN